MRNFMNLLKNRWETSNTLLCVGLDPDLEKIPQVLKNKYSKTEDIIFEFNKAIIDTTNEYICTYKPQYAFYAGLGIDGHNALKRTIEYIHDNYSDIPVILDSKRGDVGNTATQYVAESFEIFQADAVTLNPYLGYDSLEPFLKYTEKGIIILCRTSNKGASDFQDIIDEKTKLPLYQLIAQKAKEWNTSQNISLVVGATYPEEMKEIRSIVGDEIPFLVPGLGAQGGKPNDLVNGFNSKKTGIMASSSRGIIFASPGEDFAQKAGEEAKRLRDEINKYR